MVGADAEEGRGRRVGSAEWAARGGALLHGTRGFRRPVDPLVGAALRAARGLVGALGVAA